MKLGIASALLFFTMACAKSPELAAPEPAEAPKNEFDWTEGTVSFMTPVELTDLKHVPAGFEVRFYPNTGTDSSRLQLLRIPMLTGWNLQQRTEPSLRLGCDESPAILEGIIKTDVLELCGQLKYAGAEFHVQANVIIFNNVQLSVELGELTVSNEKTNRVVFSSNEVVVQGKNSITVTRAPQFRSTQGAPKVLFIFSELKTSGTVQVNSFAEIPSPEGI